MEQQEIKPGEFYQNSRQELYQAVTVASHTQTGESLVVFQKLYGDFAVCAMPEALFVRETNRVTRPTAAVPVRQTSVQTDRTPQATDVLQPENEPACEPQADPLLLRFLDAETYADKYRILKDMEYTVTDRLIDDFAAILDVVIPEGKLSVRYEQLKQCVATMMRYETTRLR